MPAVDINNHRDYIRIGFRRPDTGDRVRVHWPDGSFSEEILLVSISRGYTATCNVKIIYRGVPAVVSVIGLDVDELSLAES